MTDLQASEPIGDRVRQYLNGRHQGDRVGYLLVRDLQGEVTRLTQERDELLRIVWSLKEAILVGPAEDVLISRRQAAEAVTQQRQAEADLLVCQQALTNTSATLALHERADKVTMDPSYYAQIRAAAGSEDEDDVVDDIERLKARAIAAEAEVEHQRGHKDDYAAMLHTLEQGIAQVIEGLRAEEAIVRQWAKDNSIDTLQADLVTVANSLKYRAETLSRLMGQK